MDPSTEVASHMSGILFADLSDKNWIFFRNISFA